MWYYLKSEAYRARYAMAAHFLKKCHCIIEIGGSQGTSAIDQYIENGASGTKGQKTIVTCDPLADDDKLTHTRVSHIKDIYQNVDFSGYSDYGLCMLGVEGASKNFPDGVTYDNKMKSLIENSERTIIEYWVDHSETKQFVSDAIENTQKSTIVDIDLNLERCLLNDVVRPEESWPPRPNRRLIVLE